MYLKIALIVPLIEFILYSAWIYRQAIDYKSAGLGAIGLVFALPILWIIFSFSGAYLTILLLGKSIKKRGLCFLVIFIASIPILYIITMFMFAMADDNQRYDYTKPSIPSIINVDKTNTRIELSK